jgi:hypothetical protein
MKNPRCDGVGPCSEGEVKVLRLFDGKYAFQVLCRRCFYRDRRYRKQLNTFLSEDCRVELPEWSSLKVY